MIVRALATLVTLAAIGNGSLFAQQGEPAKVGDLLVIHMTGDLAVEYGLRTRTIKKDNVPTGLEIETTATVAQKLKDGRIRVEHTSPVVQDGEPDRLVTLTATVEATKLTTDVTPKGTAVYASPAEYGNGTKPTLNAKEIRTLRLELSGLKGLKLCTWTLADRLGD